MGATSAGPGLTSYLLRGHLLLGKWWHEDEIGEREKMNAEGGGKSDLSSTRALMVANGFHISTRTKTTYCYFLSFYSALMPAT